MIFRKLDRKGSVGEGLLYFVFFLMIFLIVGGIYGGLVSFFGEGYDYRRTESVYLTKEIKDCFLREGFFDLNNKLDEGDFYKKCRIDKSVIEDGNHLIYVKNRNGVEFSVGVTDYKSRCFFNVRSKNKDLPLCNEYNSEKGDYILVGSSQNSRRIVI